MHRQIRKIALINPKRSLQKVLPEFLEMLERNRDRLKLWFAPPLSLLTIASLTPQNIEVKIIDEHFEEIDFDQKYDLVAITAMTIQAIRAYEIAREFKLRGIPVVMGGIHATILPDEALRYVDTVFMGEAEEQWMIYLNDFNIDNVKRIYKSQCYFDLEKAALPRYDLINYKSFNQITDYFKFLPVQATRGCPHDCSFCVTTRFYGRKIRKKKIDQIIKEIADLKEQSNNSLILFVDDNLFVDRKFAKQLLNELIPLKIKYVAQSDVKVADDSDLLRLIYLSGCVMLFIGFESVNTKALNSINTNHWKKKQIIKYPEAIRKIQDNGMVVFGAFVIGFKEDTLSTFYEIGDFVIENNIAAQFTLLTPLPGSRIYEQFRNEDRLLQDEFWDKCSFFNMTFKHDNFSISEAENKIIWLHDTVFNIENTKNRTQFMIQHYKKLPERWIKE